MDFFGARLVHRAHRHRAGRAMVRAVIAGAATSCLGACEPMLVVGEWTCPDEIGAEGGAPGPLSAIAVPWMTGFEHRACDYTRLAGFCYTDSLGSFDFVRSPVHSGQYAAAFHVTTTDDASTDEQARCVRQGVFPANATYSAWYFIPAPATNAGNWNLFHFRGGDPSAQHGLWDVSLGNATGGSLGVHLFDFLHYLERYPVSAPPVPIGSWFHLELRLKRAADATGEVALYQDGQLLLELTGLVTDDTNWGQWYVGNLATALVPPDSTVYVDDVSIRTTN